MKNTLRVGIVGYGNLGKGAALAIAQNEDMELVAIFTRRPPSQVNAEAEIYSFSKIADFADKIDVMILCGGSAKDLPEQVIQVANLYHTVDSFDTHAKIPEYFQKVDETAKANGKLCLISTGWDPGLFSMMRLLGESVLPEGSTHTFWGKGLSQGHSDAVRRVPGVKNAVQYTLPLDTALTQVRAGENPDLSAAEKHRRVCYVVAEEGADQSEIRNTIQTMPHYFADYETTVHFISEEELLKDHSGMPHGGIVFRSGTTGTGSKQNIEFSLQLESNPQFTASVLVACARAVGRLAKEGETGARTVFDIPLRYLSKRSPEELRRDLL